MQSTTIDILIDKAGFEPRTAVAVAEAMDDAIVRHFDRAQIVTVPLLDSRLADLRGDLRSEMHGIKSELMRQMYIAILGQMAVLLGAAYFFATHLTR